MELVLVNGNFSPRETEQLLTDLIKVKTDFHLDKIDNTDHAEEDMKHSEKRIKELEEQLRNAMKTLRSGNYKHVTVHAKIVLELD